MKKINSNSINYTDNIYYMCRTILIIGLPLLVISALVLSHLSFHSSATSSNSGTDNLAITISSSCTLGSTVNTPHSKEVYNGNYETNIGKTTITTLCNDGNGYSIYADGYSNNEEGNNKLINSSYPQYSIDTGLATSGLTSAWAMKLNNIENDPSPTPPTIDSSYNDTYGLVPNVWTKVAYRQSGTTDMSEGSSFTTTYSVYASSSQYNGTYNGQVKYVLLHPYKNDSTITTVPTFEESFVLAGKEKVTVNGADYYKMQDMNNLICGRVQNTEETPTVQLTDARDNKIYWVAKLADGHCWMTQNLDLDLIANHTYTHEDTDLGWDPDSFNKHASWTLTDDVPSTIPYDSETEQFTGWQNSLQLPYSADPGDIYYYTSDSDENDITYNSLSECVNAGHSDCLHYHAGNYYNTTAAVASNNRSDVATGDATNSICPAGWHLPMGSSNEFGKLLYQYGITTSIAGSDVQGTNSYTADGFNKIRKSPLYLVRAGSVSDSIKAYTSSFGGYLLPRIERNEYTQRLTFKDSLINIYNGTYVYQGFSIRCLAR